MVGLSASFFNAARDAGVQVHFGHKVSDVDMEEGTMTFAGGWRLSGDKVMATDGILSKTKVQSLFGRYLAYSENLEFAPGAEPFGNALFLRLNSSWRMI